MAQEWHKQAKRRGAKHGTGSQSASSAAAASTPCRGWNSRAKCASRRRSAIRRTRSSSERSKASALRFLRGTARGHRFLPSEINYRANIYAMKHAGRRANHFRERGRFAAGRFAAARISDSRPVFRPHAPCASPHFLATASWRTWASTSPSARNSAEVLGDACDAAESEGASRRHLRLHGRSAIFDAGRSARAPAVAF